MVKRYSSNEFGANDVPMRAYNLYRSLDPWTEILRQHSEVNALSRDAELRSD